MSRRHKQLEQRVADLDAENPSKEATPEERRAFWEMHALMGGPERIVARARELAEQCAPLPTEWPPRELRI